MKLHLFGASGSGVTTLGKHLSENIGYPYFDSDHYFWESTDPPFTRKRNSEERNQFIADDLSNHPDWILGGSIINWSEHWLSTFDLVVFLWIPPDLRLERLRKRELERYGEVIFSQPERNRQYEDFIDWASGYDNNTTKGRTLAAHQEWMKKLSCPIVELKGDFSVEQRLERVVEEMKNFGNLT